MTVQTKVALLVSASASVSTLDAVRLSFVFGANGLKLGVDATGAVFTIVTLAAFAVPSSLPSFGVTVTVTVSPLAGLMLVGKPVPVQLLAVCELPSVSESEWLAPSAANASVVDCT